MFLSDSQYCGAVFRCHRNGVNLAGDDSAQRDEDRQNVNFLLQDRAERWLKQAGSRATIAAIDSPIPVPTACSATVLDRRAMKMASARASTAKTTSAASDEAVAPRAERATPTPAAARAGASLIPSPTMIVAERADSVRMAASLSAGVAICQDGVDTNDPPDHVGNICAITAH